MDFDPANASFANSVETRLRATAQVIVNLVALPIILAVGLLELAYRGAFEGVDGLVNGIYNLGSSLLWQLLSATSSIVGIFAPLQTTEKVSYFFAKLYDDVSEIKSECRFTGLKIRFPMNKSDYDCLHDALNKATNGRSFAYQYELIDAYNTLSRNFHGINRLDSDLQEEGSYNRNSKLAAALLGSLAKFDHPKDALGNRTLFGPALTIQEITRLTNALAEFHSEDLSFVVKYLEKVKELHPEMDAASIFIQLQLLDSHLAQMRDTISECFPAIPEMGEEVRACLIRALSTGDEGDYEALILEFAKLPYGDMEAKEIRQIALILLQLPDNERNVAVESMAQLLGKGFPLEGDKGKIMLLLCSIPANFRRESVNRVIQTLQHWPRQTLTPHLAKFMVLRLLQRERDQAMIEQQPLGQPVIGVNVHAGNRDQKTIQALNLLKELQGPVPQNLIDAAVNEFIDHLQHAVGISDEVRQRAQYALDGPHNGDDFGSLLSDAYCNSYQISGREVIARHWIFATTYRDPSDDDILNSQERENAKLGMLTALDQSYMYGQRICGEGKTQRLVINVLQGRLAGVSVDEIPDIVSTFAAMEMFFNIARHQAIESRTLLLLEADQFCRENGAINRDGFMAEMNSYADMQEMAD